jgi:hypothetical protein
MKNLFSNETKRESKKFHVLTSTEMLNVRGGNDTKPPTKEKDIWDLENGDN